MNEKQRQLARHALGLPNRQNTSYRNHFCIGADGDDYAEWEDLVTKGLAVKRAPSQLSGGDFTFCLTLKGALLAREPKEHISRNEVFVMRSFETHA